MVDNKDITLYPYQKGYIAEANIEESNMGNNSNYELILIVDRSGSMRYSYPILINKLIPHLLDLLKFPENKATHFIVFEDFVEYRKFTKKDFMNCTEIASGAIEKMTDVFPQLEKIFIPENQKTPFRILTLSDGELVVKSERINVPILASEFYEKVKSKFRINSQAIRYFTSSAQPDTMALASILQLNTINEATLIDINYKDSYIESAEKISELFKNDGFDLDLKIKSNKECIKTAPWTDAKNEAELHNGKNFFWIDNFDEKTEFDVKIDDKEIKMNIKYGEKLTTFNYSRILSTEISEFINKLKILKLVDGINAQKEIELIIQHFKKFEDSLMKEPEEEEIVLKDGKLASRLIFLRKLIDKRKGLISNQMDMIKNENKLSQLNSQQKADFLRNVDNTKLGKGLARRALKDGENLDDVIFREIKEISNHIDELNDIDSTNHPSSFYSISTTIESLKDLCSLYKNTIFNELEISDILKFFNIVGVACHGNIGDYPDPSIYLINKMYPGCYISIGDIITAEEYSKGNEHLKDPGSKEEINNCIPIFNDEKLYRFLKKHAPRMLELSAGLGMRRVLADIPLTFESTILSGLWKTIVSLRDDKSEININVFKDICNTMKYACGKKYDSVIEVVKKQLNDQNNKNALYINGYSLFQMLPVIYNCVSSKNLDENELTNIYRAIARFEIYKIIRTKIRKSDNKSDYIKESLNKLLGIDIEKHATELPQLFEKLENPKFYDNYFIDKTIVNEYKRLIGWTETIPYCYTLFSILSETNYIESIKNLNYEFSKEYFGISYDYDKFIAFNIVQSLIFKEKSERDDDDAKIMKIIDSNREEEVDNFLREQTKRIYEEDYKNKYSYQKKEEENIIIAELIDRIISCDDLSEFKDLMTNGITKGYLNYKFVNESSNGYFDLKNKFLDETLDVPLRFEKMFLMLTGKDENEKIIWNNGNGIRSGIVDYKNFIIKHNPLLWDDFKKLKKFYIYRDEPNRHGHSNSKVSYWAMGYKSLSEFIENSSKEEVEEYRKIHYDCCGINSLI
eukprot:jgi/Orpsp1_1/1186770/evm.model.d7180000053193.1